MADGSNPSTTVSDYLCDIQLLHLSSNGGHYGTDQSESRI